MGSMTEVTTSTANTIQWNQRASDGLSHIDRLYSRMQGIYMQRWSTNFTTEIAVETWKETWSIGLAGFTPDQIRKGLNACASLEWPPSLPEFRKLCLGEQYLNLESMFMEAANLAAKQLGGLKVEWPSKLLYWSAKSFGFGNLKTAMWEGSKKRWTDTVREMQADEPLPEIPAEEPEALPAPGKTHITQEQAQTMIGEVAAKMQMGKGNGERNEWGLMSDSWLMTVHRAPLFQSSLPHALAALRRMHWSEDKITKFSAKVWGVGEHRHIERV